MTLPEASWVNRKLSAGRYRVVAELGEGGMGQVYRAWDANLETDVVIKVPHAGLSDDPEFAGRFTREIRSLVKLSHPHIVKVIDVGEHNDRPFAVMQYLSGGSLADHRQSDQGGQPLPLAPQSLTPWLTDIAAALDFVHDRGYVHRDVKPANILFDEHGHAYLSDFGIAKVVLNAALEVESTSQTATGLVLGTPHYMSPELIMGEEFDGRADQYALAVLVYELLCGRLPIDGPTAAAILVQQINHEPTAPKSIIAELPNPVSATILRALSKDPGLRFASCADFAQAVLMPIQSISDSALSLHQREKVARNASPASIPCPSCGTTLVVLPQHAGRKVSCPRCKTRFRVRENLRGVQKLADKQTQIANHNKALVEPPTVMVSSLSDQMKSDTDARRTTLETTPHPQPVRTEPRSSPPTPIIEASENRWGSYARRRSFGARLQSKYSFVVGGLAVVGILAIVFSMNSGSSNSHSFQTSLQQANQDEPKTGLNPNSSLEVVRPKASQEAPPVSGNIKVPFDDHAEGTAQGGRVSPPDPLASPGVSSADTAAKDQIHSPSVNASSHSSGAPGERSSLPVNSSTAQPASEQNVNPSDIQKPTLWALEPEVALPVSELVNENSTGGPVRLGTLPESMLGQLQIDLETIYVDLNGGHNYEVRPANDSAGRWEVILAGSDCLALKLRN